MKVSANGVSIHYAVDGHGPWLTLAHPLGADLTVWDDLVPELAAHFRVLRYDSRGHGASDVPHGPYTIGQLAADATALLSSLEIPSTHFAGISMGGAVAQQLALDAPERVASLTLIDTTAGYDAPDAQLFRERAAKARAQGMKELANGTLERWLSAGFRQRHPAQAERIRALVAHAHPEGFAAACEALAAFDVRTRLHEIEAPTLVLVGENDPSTPPAVARRIAEGIAGARLEIVPDAAHLSIVEQKQFVTKLLATFLQGTVSNA
ncbi:3-oxoadipate enol-lactonase [Pandoraea pulmonicola]|uniref:3-oxoadipate enol-lactonase n=1 Tax=Pandoraea pulmonicola TaxID=93221 RepID=A0AAJ4ZBZ7_PANPU|nr:3-oxoadipate enol-lactonase [Pandoraea pulmonicola]AJC20816.1 3-oxoadipate enol-lactonase [Pandoraea pulmonicola]SUA90644.1 3-oxoadipate enol-lactonase 2 [Pandoraea pulmonicola]